MARRSVVLITTLLVLAASLTPCISDTLGRSQAQAPVSLTVQKYMSLLVSPYKNRPEILMTTVTADKMNREFTSAGGAYITVTTNCGAILSCPQQITLALETPPSSLNVDATINLWHLGFESVEDGYGNWELSLPAGIYTDIVLDVRTKRVWSVQYPAGIYKGNVALTLTAN